jgi:hypothetical protein
MALPLLESSNAGAVRGSPQQGLIVAFGGSVAAGEGLAVPSGLSGTTCSQSPPAPYCGYADGQWTDSPDAYASVLADSLGWSVDNFAISGACVAPNLPKCYLRPSVQSELATAKSLSLTPNLVTLTVGEDDVNFGRCFRSLISITVVVPCSNSASQLAAIKTGVTALLEHVSSAYPGVPIALTLIYDPLPASFGADTNTNSVCGQTAMLYALHQGIQQANWSGAMATFVSGSVDAAGTTYFSKLVASGTATLGKLNATLSAAAATAKGAGADVEAVTLNFVGHDFCQDYKGCTCSFVIGPQIDVSGSSLGTYLKVTTRPIDTCAVLDAGCQNVFKSGSGPSYTYAYSIGYNDFPYPTCPGQERIALQIAVDTPSLASLLRGRDRD